MRLLLAGLLLVAQQVALAHAAWHAARGTAVAHGQSVPGKPGSKSDGGQTRLCIFDAVLGQVLGGAYGSPVAGPQVQSDPVQVAATPQFCRVERSFYFLSRAPPALF